MKKSTLKAVDKYFWFVGCSIVAFLRNFAVFRPSDSRTALVRPGGLGDLVLLTLAIQKLGLNQRDFFFVVEKRSQVWAEYLGVDFICYDDATLGKLVSLWAKFRCVVNTEQRFGLSQVFAVFLSGYRSKIVSFDSNLAARFSNQKVKFHPTNTHELACFSNLLSVALEVSSGLSKSGETDLGAELSTFPPLVNSKGNNFNAEKSDLAVVAIGGLQSESRALTVQDWSLVLLVIKGYKKIVLLCSPQDLNFATELEEFLKRQQENQGSEISLRYKQLVGSDQSEQSVFVDTVSQIKSANLFLAIDSGLVHVASYFSIPSFVVFTSNTYLKWGPLAANSVVLQPPISLPCHPCALFGQVPVCRSSFRCKTLVLEALQKKRTEQQHVIPHLIGSNSLVTGQSRIFCFDVESMVFKMSPRAEMIRWLCVHRPLRFFTFLWLNLNRNASAQDYLAKYAEIDWATIPLQPDFFGFLEKLNANAAHGKEEVYPDSTDSIFYFFSGSQSSLFLTLKTTFEKQGKNLLHVSNSKQFSEFVKSASDKATMQASVQTIDGYAHQSGVTLEISLYASIGVVSLISEFVETIKNESSKILAHVFDNQLSLDANKIQQKLKNIHVISYNFRNTKRRWLKFLRVHQWSKNTLVALPVFVSHQEFQFANVAKLMVAFFSFSLLASAVYILNDFLDIDSDRHHKSKKHRPLAAGDIGYRLAFFVFLTLVVASAFLSSIISIQFQFILLCYFLLTTLYSSFLKKKLGLDVLCLATLYCIRIFAGGAAVSVPISDWFFTFTFFCFLSLALVKRVVELTAFIEKKPLLTVTGRGYCAADIEVLKMSGVFSGLMSTLLFGLYVSSSEASQLYTNVRFLWLALPALLYWFLRIWILVGRKHVDGDPVYFALKDKVTYVCIFFMLGILFLAK